MEYYWRYLRTYWIIKQKYWLNKLSPAKALDYTPFIILCAPRSGSTLLHTYLNSHPGIKSYGELREVIATGETNGQSSDIFKLVFNPHARILKAVGLKVFYGDADHERYGAIYHQLAKRKNIKVIHLIRENALEVYVSLTLARKTNVWSSTNVDIPAEDRISLNLDDYKQFVESHRKHLSAVAEVFKHHEILTVSYNDLVSNPASVLRTVQNFLGVKEKDLFTLLKKQNQRPIESVITNYQEVKGQLE